jgi:arsenite methyltransferase
MSLSPSHSPSDPAHSDPGQSDLDQLKSCCAALYQSDFARMLLGESFHPGGLRLTRRLGELLNLRAGIRVLDVASGKGDSAIFLARQFGCEVVGVDFGSDNVKMSNARADATGTTHLVSFAQGDAERLDFPDASFDAVICECAFCTFPDKEQAAAEFARVLRPAGRVGLSDLTRTGPLPDELEGLLAWVACIADARPVEEYSAFLTAAGIAGIHVEAHDAALTEMVRDIKGRLLAIELAAKLGRLNLEGIELEQAKSLARAALDAIRTKRLGYALIAGNHATR